MVSNVHRPSSTRGSLILYVMYTIPLKDTLIPDIRNTISYTCAHNEIYLPLKVYIHWCSECIYIKKDILFRMHMPNTFSCVCPHILNSCDQVSRPSLKTLQEISLLTRDRKLSDILICQAAHMWALPFISHNLSLSLSLARYNVLQCWWQNCTSVLGFSSWVLWKWWRARDPTNFWPTLRWAAFPHLVYMSLVEHYYISPSFNLTFYYHWRKYLGRRLL